MLGVMCFVPPAAAQDTPGKDVKTAGFKASREAAEADACREHLHKIHDAITAFEGAHQRLPNWLSELSPAYLDAKLLVCPYVTRIADLSSWRYRNIREDVFQDPKESTSYAYEFCSKEIPLWPGVKTTWREFKQRLVKRMGRAGEDAVPIVRCFAHEPILNVAYGGRVYSNPANKDWEELFMPPFTHEDFHPETLYLNEPVMVDRKRFLPRASKTEARLLDLSKHYNAYLDEVWLPYPRECDLKSLPQGDQEIGGVRFDVRGLAQLSATRLLAPYPTNVTGVKVGASSTKIHFLHATRPVPVRAPDMAVGTRVATYVIHYENGAAAEIPIIYGRDLKNWWFDPLKPEPGSARAAWEGENPASKAFQRKIRLFITSWQNPRKDQTIASLSLNSAMAETAPFVVAITIE